MLLFLFFMYYVYIIQSEKNGSYYKGITDDLERRLREHNNGEEKYTSPYVPWNLVWYTEKPDRKSAIVLERKLKNITAREKLESFMKKYPVGGADAVL